MTSVVPWLTKRSIARREPRLAQAVDDPCDEIAVGRRALGVAHLAGREVVGDEIGERAADIDGDDESHGA